MMLQTYLRKLLRAAVVVLTTSAALLAQDTEGSDLSGEMIVRAQLRPKLQTVLSSEISARITAFDLEAGDSFKKNDLLAAFNCVSLRAEQDKVRSTINASEAKLASLKRLSELSSVSPVELQLGTSELEVSEADMAIVSEAISNCEIRAPFKGRVMDRYVALHQFVKAGDPLMMVYATDAVEVDFLIPSSSLKWLKLGARLMMSVDETGEEIKATVSSLGSFVDPVSQTIQVRATVDYNNPNLLPGMSGTVRFIR